MSVAMLQANPGYERWKPPGAPGEMRPSAHLLWDQFRKHPWSACVISRCSALLWFRMHAAIKNTACSSHPGRDSISDDRNAILHRLDDSLLLGACELWVHRQRENLGCVFFCHREVSLVVAEGAIGFLQVKRDRVMNTRTDARCLQAVLQPITILYPYHVKVIDCPSPPWLNWKDHSIH